MKQWMKSLSVGTLVISATAMAQAKQVVCVFDLVGKNGDVYSLMKDYQLAANSHSTQKMSGSEPNKVSFGALKNNKEYCSSQ